MTLGVGLVGAGGIGEIRARALLRSTDGSLVAVADTNLERARQVAAPAGARAFQTHTDLLDAPEVDVVVVSVPPNLHEAIVLEALDAGKHVLCEKPLSNSLEGARRMVLRARERQLVLATGFNHRYFPHIQRVKRAIDSGEIGELDHVRAFAGHTGLSEFSEPWLTDPDVMGGGALMDNGIHVLDLTRYLLGEVTRVQGQATEHVWGIRGCEDNGFALLTSERGKVGTVHASWSEWRGYRFSLAAYGTQGTAWAFYAPMLSMVVALDRPGGSGKRRVQLYPRVNVMEKLRDWKWTVVQTFLEEFRDLRKLIEGERGEIADGFAGFRAVEIAHSVYRSAVEDRPIHLCDPF